MAILPYDQYMHRFAAYFQQGDMESNGKYITRDGERVDYQTGARSSGASPAPTANTPSTSSSTRARSSSPATSSPPSRRTTPSASITRSCSPTSSRRPRALAFGKTREQVIKDGTNDEKLIPHKIFEGNRPTNSIFIQKLTPRTLGSLVAMYEHKIFVQGVIWNINSYDQWGVELGKQLAKVILPELSGDKPVNRPRLFHQRADQLLQKAPLKMDAVLRATVRPDRLS